MQRLLREPFWGLHPARGARIRAVHTSTVFIEARWLTIATIWPASRTFRAYEVDLLEAHEEFAALYASGRAFDCAGLRPLHLD